MLDNDNKTLFQRQLRRSLQMKKIIANAPLCFLVCKATESKQHANSNIQLTVEKVVYLLEQQDTSSVAKEITEDILNKIYTEKGAITGMINFVHYGSDKGVYRFPSGNTLTDARERWRLVMWLHRQLCN